MLDSKTCFIVFSIVELIIYNFYYTFSSLKKLYANEFMKLIIATIVFHNAVPVKTVFFDSIHR
jgi:hypothetical protein